mmetsp:Transcript_40796/g.115467  ORF Transcript_40796/g.115467 Transcript_40796/m.115467 type:complete len:468 (+) Transcript_40796:2494-3897(+)
MPQRGLELVQVLFDGPVVGVGNWAHAAGVPRREALVQGDERRPTHEAASAVRALGHILRHRAHRRLRRRRVAGQGEAGEAAERLVHVGAPVHLPVVDHVQADVDLLEDVLLAGGAKAAGQRAHVRGEDLAPRRVHERAREVVVERLEGLGRPRLALRHQRRGHLTHGRQRSARLGDGGSQRLQARLRQAARLELGTVEKSARLHREVRDGQGIQAHLQQRELGARVLVAHVRQDRGEAREHAVLPRRVRGLHEGRVRRVVAVANRGAALQRRHPARADCRGLRRTHLRHEARHLPHGEAPRGEFVQVHALEVHAEVLGHLHEEVRDAQAVQAQVQQRHVQVRGRADRLLHHGADGLGGVRHEAALVGAPQRLQSGSGRRGRRLLPDHQNASALRGGELQAGGAGGLHAGAPDHHMRVGTAEAEAGDADGLQPRAVDRVRDRPAAARQLQPRVQRLQQWVAEHCLGAR